MARVKQTTLVMRSGVTTRVAGTVSTVTEIALTLMPISVLPFLPKMFFGAMLGFVGLSILVDYLVLTYFTMHRLEYCLVIFTFVVINWLGLQL
eukprot:gene11960-14131_t